MKKMNKIELCKKVAFFLITFFILFAIPRIIPKFIPSREIEVFISLILMMFILYFSALWYNKLFDE